MAATGTAVYPSTSLYPGSSTDPGQGLYPLPVILYSLEDASVSPSWVNATDYLRGFQTNRGRATELARVDAGTANITLDNRTRLFDPEHTAGIRPMNRWWIREQFSGETQDIFNGYAESYTQVWPDKSGVDAVTVVNCVDEFKVLALDRLPAMDPPTATTYEEVVMFDNPQGYWRMQPETFEGAVRVRATAGDTHLGNVGGSGTQYYVDSPILGDASVNQSATATVAGSAPGVGLARATDTGLSTMDGDTSSDYDGLVAGGPGDINGLAAFSFEVWFKTSETPIAATRVIAAGPLSGGANQWDLTLLTSGLIHAVARNSGGTTYQVTSTSQNYTNTWVHLAMVVSGANLWLYMDSILEGTTSWTGVGGAPDANQFMRIGELTAVGGRRYFDEPAWYRYALPQARLIAHYQAGAVQGFAAQDPGARITAVLNAADTTAPRSILAGSREMVPQFMTGQDPLSELRRAEAADAVDAVLFIAKDGTITFLDDGHRSSSPWDTIQTVFDDDVTDIPYVDIQMDYSESFLANDWNVTRTGGTTSTASDATSIDRYFKRTQSVPDLSITTDADAAAIAAAMLAKYKDPLTRVTRITSVTAAPEVAEELFRLDIGSRVQILRTPPGGGSRLNQIAFVQSIEVSADRSSPVWSITLGLEASSFVEVAADGSFRGLLALTG